jgi:hypothetical protein
MGRVAGRCPRQPDVPFHCHMMTAQPCCCHRSCVDHFASSMCQYCCKYPSRLLHVMSRISISPCLSLRCTAFTQEDLCCLLQVRSHISVCQNIARLLPAPVLLAPGHVLHLPVSPLCHMVPTAVLLEHLWCLLHFTCQSLIVKT